MLHTITAKERYEFFNTRLKYHESLTTWLAPVTSTLVQRWAHELGPVKLSIMLCLADLSLGHGRAAVEISRDALANGVQDCEGVTFCGLGITSRSVRTHIDGLSKAGFISIYRVVSHNKAKEGSTSIIEIDVKKVLKSSSNDLGKFFLGLHIDIHRYYVPSLCFQSLGSPKLFSARFAAPKPADSFETNFTSNGTHMAPVLPTPKKTRAPAPRGPETVSEAIAAANRRIAAARVVKVSQASGPVDGLTKAALQALLDKNMKEYLPNHPRVIATDKAFGLMKKRLKTAGVASLPDFINWTIRSWSSIAAQNRAAYLKNPGKTQRGTPIPAAPSFNDLAYKLPYFLAAYANRLSGSLAPEGKSADQQKIERLTAQLRAAQEEALSLRRLSQRTRSAAAIVKPPELPQRPASAQRIVREDAGGIGEDWTPPLWVEKKKA